MYRIIGREDPETKRLLGLLERAIKAVREENSEQQSKHETTKIE